MKRLMVLLVAHVLMVIVGSATILAQVPSEVARQLQIIRDAVTTIEKFYQPPPPAPEPTDPPAATLATMAVIVSDFNVAGSRIEGAQVEVNGVLIGLSNADGYIETVVTLGTQHDIRVTKDGYEAGTASDVLTGNKQVGVALIKVKPKHPNPIVGRLHIVAHAFADDTGLVLPVYEHAGDLFSIFARDAHRARDQLDQVAAAGYHGIRTWATLGCGSSTPCGPTQTWAGFTVPSFWFGQDVGPELTPGYWAQVESFFRELAARGLRVVWSQGDIGQLRDRRAYMEQLAALESRIGSRVVDWIDCGNEAWQTGEPDPAQLARCVGYYKAAGGQALVTLTSPPSENVEELDAFSIAPADAWDVHGWRAGHWWDKRRHIQSIPYEGKPKRPVGIQSEPFGGGALVSATENKGELDDEAVCNGAVASAIARQAWVHFSGEGVKVDAGLQTGPGFGCAAAATRLLPNDVSSYTQLHHSGDTWRSIRVLELTSNPSVRVDGAINVDGRFAYIADGPSGHHRFKVARAFVGKVCNTATQICEAVTRKAGEFLELDWVRGRLLIGAVQ
jgi:hypothetical protein